MKILVAYASRHGSTAEIAEAIASEMRIGGHDVSVIEAADAGEISEYDAFVIGSSIYIGQWQRSARALIDKHGDELRSKPVWLFSSGPIGEDPFPVDDPPETGDLLAKTGAREHQSFTGHLNRSTLGFGERLVTTVLRVPEGDFRDWEVIGAWANSVSEALSELEEAEKSVLNQAC